MHTKVNSISLGMCNNNKKSRINLFIINTWNCWVWTAPFPWEVLQWGCSRWDESCGILSGTPAPPAAPRLCSLPVCSRFNGTVGFEQINDPQTKNTLSRGLEIIDSNVLKGAIRYYWVNDTNLGGGWVKKVHNCIFTRLRALILYSDGSPPHVSNFIPPELPITFRRSHATYK